MQTPPPPKKGSAYQKVYCENGDLILDVFKSSNASYCGNEVLETLTDPETGLSLKCALNVKKNEEKKEEHLQTMKEALELPADVSVECDLIAVAEVCDKAGYKDRIGEVVHDWILGGLAATLKKLGADELTREAIQEVWTTGVIKIEDGGKQQKGYHECDFENGDLVLKFKSDGIASNVSYIGQDIEKKL